MAPYNKKLLEKLALAKRIGVLTGAGISAESGVATFRGKDGIWNKLKPEELASMDAFMKNPSRVLEWYEYRKELLKNIKPNAAHYTLVEMEKHYQNFTISTQNVDGLHTLAGSQNVLELHGNIRSNKCNVCGKKAGELEFISGLIFKCECGGLIRPDIVWFGEMLPEKVLQKSFAAAATADIYFSIGTSAQVYPAAMLPIEARAYGAMIVEINMERTPLSSKADECFIGKAGEILPDLWENAQKYALI